MKFQKKFEQEIEKYSNAFFISYKEGKQIIKLYKQDLSKYEIFEVKFMTYINQYTHDIKNFYELKKELLYQRISMFPLDTHGQYITLMEELSLNHLALYKITKKYDKYAMNKLQNIIMDQYKKTNNWFYFIKLDFANLLYNFSNLFHPTSKPSKEKEDKIARKTTKYLFSPSNDYKIKMYLSKHLPINTFRSVPIINQKVISIYYDSDDFKLYHDRIKKDNNSFLIRARYYLSDSINPSMENNSIQNEFIYFMEKKIHFEDFECEKSIKKRVMLRHNNSDNTMKNKILDPIGNLKILTNLNSNNTNLNENINQEILDDIISNNLQIKLRITYDRTAYELGDTRITIDSNLYYQSETKKDIYYENSTHGINFPYNVLELKIESDAECAIVDELVRQQLIVYMPKFSKYINGCSKYYPDKVNLSPYWRDSLPQFSFSEILSEKGDKIVPLANNFNLILSNEKLFITMNNYALKLFMSAFFLFYSNNLYLFGMIVFILAAYMNLFGYLQFKNQDKLIRQRSEHLYDEKYGYDILQILNLLVVIVMSFSLYFSFY
jgi:SPX domain protein involved in polyphosphate accumulation